MANVRMGLVPSIQSFTVKARNATYTETYQFIRNPLAKQKFYSDSFFSRTTLCGTDPKKGSSVIPTVLRSSCLGSNVIYPTYHHNVYLVLRQ